MTLELLEQGPGFYVPILLLSLLITVASYSFFPMLFAIIRKNGISARKYRVFCYISNFLVMVFFIALNGSSSGAPYVIWTSVFCHYGLKTLERRNLIVDHNSVCEKSSDSSLEYTGKFNKDSKTELVPVPRKKSKSRFCRFCGSLIDPDTKKCTGCGKQYFHFIIKPYTVISYSICAIFLVITTIYCVRANGFKRQVDQYKNKIQQMNEAISELESTINEKETAITDLEKKNSNYIIQIAKLKSEKEGISSKASFYDRNIVFVIDDNTRLYHKYDCFRFTWARYASSFWAYNTEQAKSIGYVPCSYCCK